MPSLLSRKSSSKGLARMVSRIINDTCDLLIDQPDGDGGVERVLDQEGVGCMTVTIGERETTHAEKQAKRGDRRFLFERDEDIQEQHTIRWTDKRGLVRHYSITELRGTGPDRPFLTAIGKRIDNSTP